MNVNCRKRYKEEKSWCIILGEIWRQTFRSGSDDHEGRGMFGRAKCCSEGQNRAGKSGIVFGRTELCWKERNTVRKRRAVLESVEHCLAEQNCDGKSK